eukprot:4410366-Alexandrium_andersonii.AAC.2
MLWQFAESQHTIHASALLLSRALAGLSHKPIDEGLCRMACPTRIAATSQSQLWLLRAGVANPAMVILDA